ncbi:MAG: hypothetical protein CV087_06805 [Candidatus Brocadia sp. WS118]|nr:MAG: hypothetical protein CV087_06805 [Candidatus Brocadia sp. WS118]
MMTTKPKTFVEIAQTLLKAIGREQLLAYFTERLNAGKDLSSRPRILAAYAQLAEHDAEPLLIQIVQDQSEKLPTRIAAGNALRSLAKQKSISIKRSDLITLMMNLLKEPNTEVLNMAAVTLIELKAKEAVFRLRQLHDDRKLDTFALEKVREFVYIEDATTIEDIIPRIDRFVGRFYEIKALTEAFKISKIVALIGLGGIGKTALAAQFVRREPYEIKLWLSGARQSDLADLAMEALSQANMWSRIGKQFSKLTDLPSSFDWRIVESMLASALHNHTVLLVIDDYDTIHHENELSEFVRNLISRLPKLNCLIVGRRKPEILNATIITLDSLDDSDAHELMRAEFALRNLSLDTKTTHHLWELAQGNPLLIKLGIEMATRFPIDEFFFNQHQDFLGHVLDRNLQKLNALQRRALEVLVQFDEPVNFQNVVIQDIFVQERIDSLQDVLQELEISGLVANVGEGLVTTHTMVRDYIRQQVDDRTTLRINQSIVDYYEKQGNFLRAVTHLVYMNHFVEAVELITEHLPEIISKGHGGYARKLLIGELAQIEKQPSIDLYRLTAIGNLCKFFGEPKSAIEHYEKALNIARKIGDLRVEGSILGSIGYVYSQSGDARRAIEFYEKHLGIAGGIGDRHGEGDALSNLGTAYFQLGDVRRAIEFYKERLAIASEISDRHGEYQDLGNLGNAYLDLGESLNAIRCHEKSLVIAQEIRDRQREGQAQGNLGNAYHQLGNPRRAIEFYEKSLLIAREIDDRYGEGKALGNMGNSYLRLGDLRRAIDMYEGQLAIVQEIGDRHGESQVLGNLGNAYFLMSDYQQAILFYEKGLALSREIGNRDGEGKALGNLGNAYRQLGDSRQAIEFHKKHLAMAHEIGDRRGEASALGNLGVDYRQLGDPHQAIEYYEKSLDILRKIGDRHGEGQTLGNLGNAYANLGDRRRAIEFHEKNLAIVREIGDQQGEGAALGNLGNAYRQLGDPHQAIELYIKSLVIAQKTGDRQREANALGNLGNAYGDIGQTDQAVVFYEKSLTMMRQIGDLAGTAFTSFNLAVQLLKQTRLTDAFGHAEYAKQVFLQIGLNDEYAAMAQNLVDQIRSQLS